MRTDHQDVILVTDDDALHELARRTCPPRARFLRVFPAQADEMSVSAAHWWIDLDANWHTPPARGRRSVYFYSDGHAVQFRPPATTFIRKPCSNAIMAVLWANACGISRDRPGDPPPSNEPPLPAWISEFQTLDPRELAMRIVRDLKRRWRADAVTLYLTTVECNGLVLIESSDPLAPASLGYGEYPLAPPTAVARRGELVVSPDLPATLAARRIVCRHDERFPTSGILAPLTDDGEVIGLLQVGVSAAELSTIKQLPLRALCAFLGRALVNAQRYQRARSEARIDRLTGLYNYRWLIEALQREIPRSRRHSGGLCLLLLDLDGLKSINDRFGHRAGDAALQHVAQQLRACLRKPDSAARIGGDEFVVLLPATTADGSHSVATRILEALRADPPHIAGQPQPLTASLGVAEWRDDWDAEALIEAADRAMYTAKGQGRDRMAYCPQPATHVTAVANADLA